MSRIILIIIAVSMYFHGWADHDPVFATSNISAVKVFRQGALVVREAQVQLPSGTAEVHFAALSPFINENSIQVQSGRDVTILSVTSTREYLSEIPMPPAYTQMQKQIETLESQVRFDKATQEVLQEEESLLFANKQTGGQQSGVSAANLEQVATYFRTRLAVIKKEKISITEKIQEAQKQLDKLRKQQAELRSKYRPDNALSIVVRVQSSGGKSDFRVQYISTQAEWQSTYDIRVADVNQPLRIDAKAEVFNRTGEDWEDVTLTLSTGDPSRINTVPVLFPWWVDYWQPPVAYRQMQKMDAANMRTAPAMEADMAYMEGQTLATSEEQLTTTEYTIRERFTIPATGKGHTVLLESKDRPAEYTYVTAPKQSPYAFLTATIHDFEQLNISSGQANIYYGQTYVANTWLDSRQTGDSLVLSLGADLGITVQRDKVKDKSARNFFGNKIEETHTWSIKIKNNKPGAIRIRIQDQLPISKNEDIEIKHEIANEGQLNAETGIITWEKSLQSAEQSDLRFTYKARYSKGKEVRL